LTCTRCLGMRECVLRTQVVSTRSPTRELLKTKLVQIKLYVLYLGNMKRPRVYICCDRNTMGVAEHERSLRGTRDVSLKGSMGGVRC
jgi:hypothetical protein